MAKKRTHKPAASRAVHVLAKPRGAICNLACRYCFYLEKEQLYPGANFRMSEKVQEAYLRQVMTQPVPQVTIAWQGGEPTLMGLDFFRRAVALEEQFRRPGQSVENTIQTNGLLLDDEWGRFLHDNNFLVGLSLDGPQGLHDAYRVDKGGRPSFERVMAALRLLQKHQVEFNVLACVHSINAMYPLEVYRFLRDEAKAQFIQFIPIVEALPHPTPLPKGEGTARPKNSPLPPGKKTAWPENPPLPSGEGRGEGIAPYSVTGRQYGDFLNAIFDEWLRRDVGQVFVQLFDVALGAWYGQPASLCIFAETCGQALALEHNGDLYSCDHFVEPENLLGNILEQSIPVLAGSSHQRAFGLAKRDALPGQCRSCDVRFACNGGCPKDRLLSTATGEPGLNYLCEGYQAFFRHIDAPMQRMANLLRSGRPPAEVMQQVA